MKSRFHHYPNRLIKKALAQLVNKYILPVLFAIFLATTIHLVIHANTLEIQGKLAKSNSQNKNLFIENKGQWDENIKFLTQSINMDVWITKQGVIFDFHSIERNDNQIDKLTADHRNRRLNEVENTHRRGHVIRMKFSSSSYKNTVFRGVDKQTTYYHYFIGNDPSQWARFVPLYREVIVENLYPGIDMRCYYEPAGFRYDFIVLPEASVEDISLAFEGTNEVWINSDGELVIQTSLGKVYHRSLKAFQEIEGEIRELPGKFHRKNNGDIGFTLQHEDKTKPLIIDPLVSSSFLGGTSSEAAYSITLDNNDNVYVTGVTWSGDFPTTPGAYQETYQGRGDVFISKFNPDLSQLLHSTFLGGSQWDEGYKLILDNEGKVYVTGTTPSSDFPTTPGVYGENLNGNLNVFVSILSTDLSNLLYSTFLGGSAWDIGFSLALDSNKNIYVTGYTESNDYPATPGAYSSELNGGVNAFVSTLTPDLSELLYSTFLGGAQTDWAYSLVLNDNGNVYVVGYTESDDYPTTPDAFDNTFNGVADGFISTLSPDLGDLLFSTLLGGTNTDWVYSIDFDGEGNVYVTGNTESFNFPTTPGAYDNTYNTWGDVFVSALSPDLSTLHYSTFVGGSDRELGINLVLDDEGRVYVTGLTESTNYPTTTDAYDTTFNGGSFDAFMSILNFNLSELLYSTYLGGSEWDLGYSIALGKDRDVYIAGYTRSSNYPTTPGAYSQDFNGAIDVFITKFKKIFSSIDDYPPHIPHAFELHQNYPNPFNPSTRIRYGLPERSNVQIDIYNMLGQQVASIVNAVEEAGYYEVEWFAGQTASGIYFYRMEAVAIDNPSNRFITIRRMVLIK